MRFGTLVGWGITIYAIMALSWSAFIIYGLARSPVSHFIEFVVLIVLLLLAGRSLRLHDPRDVVPYSLGWMVIMILLDCVYIVPFGGWTFFTDWNVWLGYGLVLVIPLIAPYTGNTSATMIDA